MIVTADGRVFADFGVGYEQVVRACIPSGLVSASAPVGTLPVYTLPTYGPATYPTPAPSAAQKNAQPASTTQRPATSSQSSSQIVRSTAGGAACWTPDAYGRVTIIR